MGNRALIFVLILIKTDGRDGEIFNYICSSSVYLYSLYNCLRASLVRIKEYIWGLILGPVFTIVIWFLLLFFNGEAWFLLMLLFGFIGGIIPPYILMYGSFAILFQIRSLPGLILLTNFLPLVFFGANCFRNGCLHLFKDGGSGLHPMYFFVLHFHFGQSYFGYLLETKNRLLLVTITPPKIEKSCDSNQGLTCHCQFSQCVTEEC